MLAESSCAYTKIKQIEYYSNEENYIEVTGTISHVVFDDEYKTLYLGFSDLSDTFADNTFELTAAIILLSRMLPGNRLKLEGQQHLLQRQDIF